jgi:hypothetical protein
VSTKNTSPARSNIVVLKQLLKHIPRRWISEVARETGVEAKARAFCVFSHLCSMLFAQLTHAVGLNDVCDWLRLKQAALAGVGAVPPSRSELSHANKVRPAKFIETLFWRVLERLQNLDPSFAIVDTAGEHDNKRAREVCAGIAAGEIVVFDKTA